MVAKGWWGGENGDLLFNGDSVSVLQDEEKFWRWIVVIAAQQCEYT